MHPDDERYRDVVGRRVRIPFVERDVPVIADPIVEREFGTGALKITPAHDHDDYATGKRHDLPMITVLNDDATINEAGAPFTGLDRYAARERILEELRHAATWRAKQPHEMVIGRCQRSNDVIEPRLKTQWFIRTEPLAAKALAATRDGRTRILPARFEKTWEHWMTSIRDWNVSRQLWWGHRIPAWYCPDGHVTVSSEPDGPPACEVVRPARQRARAGPRHLRHVVQLRAVAVLDPRLARRDAGLRALLPDVGHGDGLRHHLLLGRPDDDARHPAHRRGALPHGLPVGPDPRSRRPEDVEDEGQCRRPAGRHRRDRRRRVALRGDPRHDPRDWTRSSGAPSSSTPATSPTSCGTRHGSWLGARPASIPADAPRAEVDERRLGPTERWLRSRVAATTAAVDEAMAGYAFGEVTRILYDAIWSEFCDWGLELAKVRLADESLPAEEREATWWTLVDALDAYLRLLHPVMPFVTEALWPAIPHRASDPELLIVARWPAAGERDLGAEARIDAVFDTITAIRNARATARIDATSWLETHVAAGGDGRDQFAALAPAIERLARARRSSCTIEARTCRARRAASRSC